jgi:hypothetical protein
MCNKFLTLGFRCEQEGVLGFQGRIFSPIFGWECLHTMTMETRKMSSDVPPSSLRDPKWVQRVGFAEMVRNLVPFPASNTKRGGGVVLEALGLD